MDSRVTQFNGVIRSVRYHPALSPTLTQIDIDSFDINTAKGFCSVRLNDGLYGVSKWVSPKRTRSFPYARLYNCLHMPKTITVIPIMKDEGAGGDMDRVNFMTLALMNLLNVYVVLTWYESASPHRSEADKVTNQKMSTAWVNTKIAEIALERQSALHWNVQHFQRDFVHVYESAVESYARVSAQLGIPMHNPREHRAVLERYTVDGRFDADAFRDASLVRSFGAAQRELATRHVHEFLEGDQKAYLALENYLGGKYHLTVDELIYSEDVVILQESKNSSRGRLPTPNDIKDGLLKLILYNNLDELRYGNQPVKFLPRLKLTGRLTGSLTLPAEQQVIDAFTQLNAFNRRECALLDLLNREAQDNTPLTIWITGNT